MKQPYLQTLLHKGIAAAKAGHRDRAVQILLQVVEADETIIIAWLWLSTVVDDPTDKFICLQNVLKVEPDNQAARLGLARLEGRSPPETVRSRSSPSPPLDPTNSLPPPKRKRLKKLEPRGKPKLPEQPFTYPPKDRLPCPFCHQSISPTATTCSHCHLPLIIDCPACSTRLDVEQSFCPHCRRKIGNYRRKLTYFAGLAAAYREHGHHLQALKTWKLIEAINPNFPQLYVRLGQAQAQAGRTDAAIANLQQALEREPGHLAASLVLGKIYGQLHQWRQARTVFDQALAVTPNSPQLHFALAETLLEQRQKKQARSHLERVVRLDPQHSPAWVRLGQIYQEARKSRLAAYAYRRALQLLPPGSVLRTQAEKGVSLLDPELPAVLASGWLELFRQMLGPVLICVLAALLDAGLRPWWIPWMGWVALLLGMLGAFLWTTGASLPKNPAVQLLTGEEGIISPDFRSSMAFFGGFFWLVSLGFFLLPFGQAYPELPQL